jgi:pyruvate dehydrogenase (quinone)
MTELTEVLRQAGVVRVYDAVEDGLTPFLDAVWRTDGVAWLEARDEQAAAFAAVDEAQATGQPAVCAGTYEAGRTHLIDGLYGVHRTGAPVQPGPEVRFR